MGAPITLTPAQFAKTGAAKSGGTYASYVKYVTKARGNRNAASGLGTTPGVNIDATIARLIAPIKAAAARFVPQTDAQLGTEATGYVKSQIDPIVQQITNDAQARAKAGMGAIGSLTKELQTSTRGAAGDAQKQALLAAAARASIGQNLAGAAAASGQAGQADVAAKLAQAGNNGASDVFAQNTGALGTQIAATAGAHGATDAANVLTRGSADAQQAEALPGIAALSGIRSGRILQEQTQQGMKENLDKLLATVPGLTAQIKQSLEARRQSTRQSRAQLESQAASAGISIRAHMTDQEIQKALARQGLGLDLTKLGVQANIADQAAATATAKATAKTDKAAADATAKNAGKAQAAVVKANGVAVAYLNKNVKPVPVYKTVQDMSTLPPTQKQVVVGYKGYPSYYDTIHGIEAQIAPILGPYASHADVIRAAQRIVNSSPHYKPGMNGRPGAGGSPAASATVTHGNHGTTA